MEIGENEENTTTKKKPQPLQQQLASTSSTLHTTQSQPIIVDQDDDCAELRSNKKKENEKLLHGSTARRVSFANSSQLAQYLEPINPFESFAIPIANSKELSSLYQLSCEKHKTKPIPIILEHLESLNLEKSSKDRTEVLSLRQQSLTQDSCEALEELFKRVKYRAIDVTSCNLDDSSASSLFDMIEYYEACNELNISENTNIKSRGWQACINMIKRSQALHSFATRGTPISDQNASAFGNALSLSFIYTLKLENCGLSGRPLLHLCGALQKNRILKELCLANNELNSVDASHIGNILKNNYHLQLLDVSNNDIQDDGFHHIAVALGYQSVHVSKTSSIDSLSSVSLNKFDFSDLTANSSLNTRLNSINNNRNRFSPTPPLTPLKAADNNSIHHHKHESSVSSLNNNSILQQCDNDGNNGGVGGKCQYKENESADKGVTTTRNAIFSTNKSTTDDPLQTSSEKFKYTTESLSPISHGYDDTTTNHQLFNSRSPERSFSSESLCSETSVESNDSKSSIRLFESKFHFNNRNGTLERQQQQKSHDVSQAAVNIGSAVSGARESGNNGGDEGSVSSMEKPLTGLQVLILWNNNLTSGCAASAADLFECTEHLQIINFGQNDIGNEFLVDTKSSLKGNESVTCLGLQATNLTCNGLKTLAEILGGNSTLQRIDLRNNCLEVEGLSALNEALKFNKSVIRLDLDDDAPKKDSDVIISELQRLVALIRQQCSYNENPPIDLQQETTATATTPRAPLRPKRANINLATRKISLTCTSVKVSPKQQQQSQLLEPIKKQSNNRLRSPSPTLSPSPSSPLASPSRSRFQVSRVSESSSSGVSSKSPSSSSSSPTFFPSAPIPHSRFRVVSVSEPITKRIDSVPPLPPKVVELKTESSKEIDIPAPKSTSFLSSSISSSIASSQSCEQLDSCYDIKRFSDLGDSCSSFSSSIESIDHHTDVSSNESFDMIEKSPTAIQSISKNPSDVFYLTNELLEDVKVKDEIIVNDYKQEVLSNENTLTVSTSSSSSSNEGLTLTTNSPTEQSPKQDTTKRTRKTSWIQSAIGANTKEKDSGSYPATLDKLLNLFHHPSSLFTKSSLPADANTLSSSPASSSSLVSFGKPPTATISTSKSATSTKESLGMCQKESSISGIINSIVALTSHKKDLGANECAILQNISPENSVEKSSTNTQMLLESIPKCIKTELKENISPENTISCETFATLEQKPMGKVLFVVGDEDDSTVTESQSSTTGEDEFADDEN